jgi:alpha-ketoglutarate-dependent taurine dioxygenase
MRVVKLEGPFGAEVTGLNPGQVTESEGEFLRELLSEHRVLVVQDMQLSPAEHLQLMS